MCEGGVGLERLCKGHPSLGTKAIVPQTKREGQVNTQAREGWEEGHTHWRVVRVVLVLSASARAFPPSAPRLLTLRLQGRAGEHSGQRGMGGGTHSLEGCESGVGLERLCKGPPSLITKAVIPETAREGR